MKRYIHVFYVMMAGVLLFASCLGSDSTSSDTVYDDTAITSFKLATVNRYLHTTTSSGKDSVYKKTLSDPVVFTIDQTSYEIYNTDSLPYGSDVKHVLASITSKNSTNIFLKSVVGDTLFFYNSTDSIDFSKPRKLVVYNSDGSSHRDYTVTVNVHQQEVGKLIWQEMPATSYPVDTNKQKWQQIVADAGLESFIGAGRKEAYAFSKDHKIMVSKDEGKTWTPDSVGDDQKLLPKESVAFVSFPFKANENTDYQLMAGVIEEGEIVSMVWRKIAEYDADSEPCKWVNIPYETYNAYHLPALPKFDLVYFQERVLAIDCNLIYVSRDGGITWKTSEDIAIPQNCTSLNVEATTDSEGNLWFKDNDANKVWRGSLLLK